MDMNKGGLLERRAVPGGGSKGGNWDNCNSTINKIFLKRHAIKKSYNSIEDNQKEHHKFSNPFVIPEKI